MRSAENDDQLDFLYLDVVNDFGGQFFFFNPFFNQIKSTD